MTSNANRELSEAVAQALGWRWIVTCGVWVLVSKQRELWPHETPMAGEPPAGARVEWRSGCYFYDSSKRPPHEYRDIPEYAIDPDALPEQLAWLMSRPGVRAVHVTVLSYAVYARVCFDSASLETECSGATIYEAVARLVCAVAKAKKEQGK